MKKYVKIHEGGTIIYKNRPIRIPRDILIENDLDLQELEAALRIQGISDYEIVTEQKIVIQRKTPQPKQKIISTIPMRPSVLSKMNVKG